VVSRHSLGLIARPQALKSRLVLKGINGTTEVVPFPRGDCVRDAFAVSLILIGRHCHAKWCFPNLYFHG
jgi:hypothetical protein